MIAALPLLAWPGGPPRLTILFYHRVLPTPDPLRPGEIHAAGFEEQMALVARHFDPLPLAEAVERLAAGTLPRRACCITFDDGYADNFSVARPILEKHRLPATVFVATAYLDGGRMFNDTLTEIVGAAEGTLLDLDSHGFGRHPITSIEERRAAVRNLLERAKRLPPPERTARIDAIVAARANDRLPGDLMMTSAQVAALPAHGIEVGGHTDTHAILTTLDIDAAREEIVRGRRRLEAITQREVRLFAYPNGAPTLDYRAEHAALVRESGFRCAVTTARGVATAADDPYQLPRFAPWSHVPLKFCTHLVRNARVGRPAALATGAGAP